VLVTAVLWGCSGSLSKYLMQGGVSPLALAQGRSVVTAALLLLYLAFARPRGLRVPRRAWLWLLLFGIFLAAVQVTYFSAIERLAVAAAILLEYLSPAMVVMFGWLFLHRRVTRTTVAALVAALVGCALVVRAYDPAVLSLSAVGIAFGVGAAVSFSGYILVGEHLKNDTPVSAQLLYGFAIAAIILALARPPWTLPAVVLQPRNLVLIATIGIFGTILPFGCFLASFQYIDAGRATIVSTLEPVVAGVVSWIWFREVFSAPQMLGAALVIGAVIALQRDRPDDEAVAARTRWTARMRPCLALAQRTLTAKRHSSTAC
jgi:drug/metabolite transporter (DMT)-like permease